MNGWDDAGHVMWNGGALAVMVVALVALVSPRSRGLRHGWKSKVLWTLSLLIGFSLNGFYVPLGPILVLSQLTRGWRQLDEVKAEAA